MGWRLRAPFTICKYINKWESATNFREPRSLGSKTAGIWGGLEEAEGRHIWVGAGVRPRVHPGEAGWGGKPPDTYQILNPPVNPPPAAMRQVPLGTRRFSLGVLGV